MPDLESRLELFHSMETVLKSTEPFDTKFKQLFALIENQVPGEYFILFKNTDGTCAHIRKALQKACSTSDIPLGIAGIQGAVPVTECMSLSGDEVLTLFGSTPVPQNFLQSFCVVFPFMCDNIIGGILCVSRNTPFSELEIADIAFFSSQVQNAVYFEFISARDITDKMQVEEQRTHLTAIANDILQRKNLKEILETVAKAIKDYCKFGRVIISLLNEEFEATNLAFAGITEEEKAQALRSHFSPEDRKKIFDDQFLVSQSYYIPHDKTPWREVGVKSQKKPDQMKDWHPDDFLFIPLYGENKKVIGLISVDDPADGRAPTAERLAPVELFATQAAIAIENARLYQEISTHAEELESKVSERTRKREALLEISYLLRETTSWDKGMMIILEGITKGFDIENAELFLINESKKSLENIAVVGVDKKEDIPLDSPEYVAARCIKEKRPINVKKASVEVEKQIEPVLESFAWIPIMTQDEVLGAISVYNLHSQLPISDDDIDDLLLFANQAAHFVESTRFLIHPAVENSLDTKMKYNLESGESYLIKSKNAVEAFDIFLDAVTHGIQGFSICRIHPKKVTKKYKLEKTPVLWLSTMETEYSIDPKDLAKINHIFNEFVKKATDSVLLLEGLEYLIIQNDFDKVIKAMHNLNDYITINNSRLLVPVNPTTLSEKELSLLEKEFRIFT